MKNRRGLLQLEGLTERIVPAVSIRAVDGDLIIKGTPNSVTGTPTLAINVTNDNEVTITDGSTNRGTYFVDGDLIMNLSNRGDSVTINLSNGDLDGSVIANLANGNDSLTIKSSGGARRILGGVTVDGGNGNDSLTVFSGNASLFEIQGGISFSGGSGSDTATFNGTGALGALELGNNQVLTRVNTVSIGQTKDVSMDGGITINASADKLIPLQVDIGDSTTSVPIAGVLSITGTDANDSVSLENVSMVSTVPTSDSETDVYEVTINLGRSTSTGTGNVLNFTDVTIGEDAALPGQFSSPADFSYTGGKGKDSVNIDGSTVFTGDSRFTLGDGTNGFTVTDASAVSGVEFLGNVTITGGTGIDQTDFAQSEVGGLLTATLGNGDNSLISAGVIAGGLSYSGLKGADNITLSNCANLSGSVTISLGGGTTSCTFSNTNGTTNMDSFTVDLGTSVNGTNPAGIEYASELDTLIVFLNPGVVSTTSLATLN